MNEILIFDDWTFRENFEKSYDEEPNWSFYWEDYKEELDYYFDNNVGDFVLQGSFGRWDRNYKGHTKSYNNITELIMNYRCDYDGNLSIYVKENGDVELVYSHHDGVDVLVIKQVIDDEIVGYNPTIMDISSLEYYKNNGGSYQETLC